LIAVEAIKGEVPSLTNHSNNRTHAVVAEKGPTALDVEGAKGVATKAAPEEGGRVFGPSKEKDTNADRAIPCIQGEQG
jgi:hypothetical protein